MYKEGDRIHCARFQNQESLIKDSTDKINKAKSVPEKAAYAERLQREANILLSCLNYDEESLDCKNCHIIATLHKQAARLIVKIGV